MNISLLAAAALMALIGFVHSVMGEQQIFRTWVQRPPPGLRRLHQQILRASWHLPSLLGFSQAAALAWLGTAPAADLPAAGLQQALLASLAAGVAACGTLVLWMTQGRHLGGAALLSAAALVSLGMIQAGSR